MTAFGGHRFSHGWADNQKVFFWAEVSRPGELDEEINADTARPGREPRYGYLRLGKTEPGEQVLLKVALSPVSVDEAKANMAAELPEWDFDGTRAAAKAAWNKELSRIDVETADETSRTIFYTALFHSMIHPSAFCDVSGDYRGADLAVHTGADYTYSTVFSLWDTYRAEHPFLALMKPVQARDMAVSNVRNSADKQSSFFFFVAV